MKHGLSPIEITKANGEKSTFESKKLFESLLRSGADRTESQGIVDSIADELYPGISTKEIYRKAFSLLRSRSRVLAARYNLKNAIMQLGPSGYPFEKYIGSILQHQGYRVQVAKLVQGQCVNHEVDVIAEKGDEHFMIECKYHNQQGTLSDVKIPLYINSRFLDVSGRWQKQPGHHIKFHQGWVITNTRFTLDALQYGKCAGLRMIGWDYPTKGSLKDMIDTLGLYPITAITSLTLNEKKDLLAKGIVLCLEISSNQQLLAETGIKENRSKVILNECKSLCHFIKNAHALPVL